jgi:zinc protease
VKDYHAKWIVPNISQVVVVGSLPKDQVLSKLGFLKSWPKKAVNYPTEPATPADEPTTIYLIDKAAAPQSEIRMGYLSLPYDATGEFYRATLMNFNQNLRETKGWTYGASSRFSGSRFKGSFTAAAGVKASSTDSAVFEFISEIRNMAEKGIRADELDYLRKALGQEDALKYEAGFQKAGFLSQILRYDLPADFTDQQSRILESITAAELNSVAKKLLQPDRMRIVIVGDKATIQKGLTRLKYPIKEMPMAK